MKSKYQQFYRRIKTNILKAPQVFVFSSALCVPCWSQDSQPIDPSTADITNQPDADTSTPVPDRVNIDVESEQRKQQLAIFDPQQLQTLTVENTDFIALWEPATAAQQYGAILLIHDQGHHADWPNTMRSIRSDLSQYGWSTLSISLPNPISSPIPARVDPTPKPGTQDDKVATTQSDTASQTSPTDPSTPTPQPTTTPDKIKQPPQVKMEKYFDAAIQFLNQKGQFNIVVAAQGLGATRAAEFIDGRMSQSTNNSAKVRPIRAFIMINARNLSPNGKNITDFLVHKSLPVLDLYSPVHYVNKNDSRIRKANAKKRQLSSYYQKHMLSTSIDSQSENRLTKYIRGFLNRHAKGVEIESN